MSNIKVDDNFKLKIYKDIQTDLDYVNPIRT